MERSCADSATVAAWISGRLPAADAESLERHADRCPTCLQILAAIGRICADPHSRALLDEHGTPLLSDWALLAGAPEAVGRYSLVEVLGRGGFGVVYGAQDELLGRRVAIKALAAIDRDGSLLAEARALAAIDHPGVVGVFDVVETAGRVYLVMERIAGETLRQWQRRHAHDVAAIVDAYRSVAHNLAAVHAAGLVHGDVKPDNVLLAEDGRVLLVDFGLSRLHRDPGARAIGGTPRYLAPETSSGTIGPRSDQYAFCVSMYEALHGALPGDEPVRTAPRRLRAVLRRGRAEVAADRWPDMQTLAAALEKASRRRSGWWPAGLALTAAAAATLPWANAAPVIDPPVVAPLPEVAPRGGSEPIELAIAARLAGDYVAADAALRPLVDGTTPTTALLQTRARHELGRIRRDAGRSDAHEALVAAHDAAAAQGADLLAATIAIDLATLRAEAPAQLDDARVWLRTAEAELRRIAVDPTRHGGIVAARATIAESAGDFPTAAADYERASILLAEQDPIARIDAHLGWASTLASLGDHDRALAKVTEARTLCDAAGVRHGRARIEAHRSAANVYGALGRFDDAVAEIERALESHDASPGATDGLLGGLHTDLGVYHLQRHDRAQAVENLQRAVALSPTSWTAHANLAVHYSRLECRADIELPECDPEASELGLAHELRALELARDKFGDEHPKFATMKANTARHLLGRGELDEALVLYTGSVEQLRRAYGDDAQQLLNPLYGLVEVSVRKGDREGARAAARALELVARGPAVSRKAATVAVLDYVVGRTLAWSDPSDPRARSLAGDAVAFFGDAPPDDFRLIDAWFLRRS